MSDLGIAFAVTMIFAAVQYLGAWNVMKIYGFPYLWTNHWIREYIVLMFDVQLIISIVTITFLQHTDISLPYYTSKSWTFVRGAASAIDRDFGFIGRQLFHGAIETHVLHHHASKIPFYHAAEASAAMRKIMGKHYVSDFDTPYLWAFWKTRGTCRFVEHVDEDKSRDIFFFPRVKE